MNRLELESFGKQAAVDFIQNNKDLNDSITKIAEHYNLNKQQINRVVESANTNTYLALFNNSDDKYIQFPVATTEKIAEHLNHEEPKLILNDYAVPPSKTLPEISIFPVSAEKTASLNPYSAERMALLQRVQAADNYFLQKIAEYDTLFLESTRTLYKQVKQEVLSGQAFGQIKLAMKKHNDCRLTDIFLEDTKKCLKEEDRLLNLEDHEKLASIINPNSKVLVQLDSMVKLATESFTWREKYANFIDLGTKGFGRIFTGIASGARTLKKSKVGLGLTGGAVVGGPIAYYSGKAHGAADNSALKNLPTGYKGKY